MSRKEQQRAVILTGVIEGRLTASEGAELMCLSERHLRRLRGAFVWHGPAHSRSAGVSYERACQTGGFLQHLLAVSSDMSIVDNGVRWLRHGAAYPVR